jgi:putative ABC transport system permease protein
VLSLGLALGSAVRRQRRELAVLKALGFTPRDVGATVAWQAITTVAVGLLIGIPAGVVLGRATWSLFTGQLDVLDRPEVPVLVVVGVAAAAIVVAYLVAWVPSRWARRADTALLLRSE